jgi:hypothetical protein
MALVFDNRHNLQGSAGIHALIAGVSHYTHLPGGGGPPAKEEWDLPQLSATALTGYKIYRWLIDHRKELLKPLATVRLLLSPSAAEESKIAQGMTEIRDALAGEPVTLSDTPSRCTLDTFAAEAGRWKTDAISDTHDEHLTFFYFAGHGIQRKNNDPVLLVEDFGNPDWNNPVAKTVAFNALFEGMAPPSDSQQKIARTQLYFVDACRVPPKELKKYSFPNVGDILGVELGGEDRRSAPIFYATVSNTKAYAKSGEQTLFSEALIDCLNGDAVKPTKVTDDSGYARYHVSIYSLAETLNAKAEALRALDLDQEFYPTPSGRDETIVNFPKPPEVECALYIDPETAAQLVSIDVRDAAGSLVKDWNLTSVKPHPFRKPLRVGIYSLQARITQSPHPPYVDPPQQLIDVVPQKEFTLKARMIK